MQVCLKVVQSSEEAQSFLADGCHPLKSAFAFDRLLLRLAADGVPAGGQTIMWYMFLPLRVGMHFPHFSLYDVLYIINHAKTSCLAQHKHTALLTSLASPSCGIMYKLSKTG